MVADVRTHEGSPERRTALQDPWLVRWGLIIAAVGVVGVLVIVPVINVFYEALGRGAGTYIQNLLADRGHASRDLANADCGASSSGPQCGLRRGSSLGHRAVSIPGPDNFDHTH